MMEDWVEVEIIEVLKRLPNGKFINQGWSPQCKSSPSANEDTWGVLKTTAIQKNEFLPNQNKELPESKKIRPQLEVNVGDILLTCAGPRNRCGVSCLVKKTRKRLLLSGKMYRFQPNPKILSPNFLILFLQSLDAWSQIDRMKTGGSESGLNLTQTRFKKLTFLIPPLPIQRAIVARIEELFGSLDQGIADLQRAQEQLRVYRQAVLKKLYSSFSGEIKLIKNVVEKVQIGPFGSQLHKADYISGGIPLVNPMHIKGGKIVPKLSYSVSVEKRNSLPNYILKEGDVIMGRRGEMGRAALVTQKESGWMCGTGSLYLRPFKDCLFSPYLDYYLRSAKAKEVLKENASGTTMRNLNKRIVNNLSIPIPPIDEQKKIVQEIESRLSICDQVEANIQESLAKAEALRQSILKKAFEGKLLTAAEIAACKQEADYEPAGVLLERIKAN